MPRLKQPVSLKEMSMKVLVEYFTEFFRKCTHKESLAELREGVAFIKNEIRPQMPATLAVELYNSSLVQFSCISHPDSEASNTRCMRIALELLMDDRITGFKLRYEMISSLELEDFARIHGITEIHSSRPIPHSLEILHLKDLTVFEYVWNCTDSDLATLSKHRVKLERVDVSGSGNVTDLGLRALAECPGLRYLSVGWCHEVSLSGLFQFLSVNKTIRELFAWPDVRDNPGFDVRRIRNWHLDPSVYRSIESFSVRDISDRHLLSIVAKFPNLRSIDLNGTIEANLSVLESLSKLSKIHFCWHRRSDWVVFESLLERVGPRIRHLKSWWCGEGETNDTQRCLNSIFRHCENLEILDFQGGYGFGGGKLVVPPFEKLKTLQLRVTYDFRNDIRGRMKIELGPRLMLENLVLGEFDIDESRLESIILDHTSFPNLKYISLEDFDFSENSCYIKQLAIKNNLELSFF